MSEFDSLPYRPCVGMMIANRQGKIFVGQRLDGRHSQWGDCWQMPQGGIDEGEDARTAALRELTEETGLAPEKVEIIAESKEQYFYDLPPELLGKIWKGRFRGQQQDWFLMRFSGEDEDIDIATKHPEFSAWKWADPEMLPDMIVPFKRDIYRGLLREFGELI